MITWLHKRFYSRTSWRMLKEPDEKPLAKVTFEKVTLRNGETVLMQTQTEISLD